MKEIKAAIIGYGNIGRYVFEALQKAPDFELAGVIRRPSSVSETPLKLSRIKVSFNLSDLGENRCSYSLYTKQRGP